MIFYALAIHPHLYLSSYTNTHPAAQANCSFSCLFLAGTGEQTTLWAGIPPQAVLEDLTKMCLEPQNDVHTKKNPYCPQISTSSHLAIRWIKRKDEPTFIRTTNH